jgi:hypothetical protein
MNQNNPWSRLREEWEVIWVKPSYKNEFDEPPYPHAFVVTRSDSMSLLLKGNASKKQVTKELVGLQEAIKGGLLDDLEHDIPPGNWIADDYSV